MHPPPLPQPSHIYNNFKSNVIDQHGTYGNLGNCQVCYRVTVCYTNCFIVHQQRGQPVSYGFTVRGMQVFRARISNHFQIWICAVITPPPTSAKLPLKLGHGWDISAHVITGMIMLVTVSFFSSKSSFINVLAESRKPLREHITHVRLSLIGRWLSKTGWPRFGCLIVIPRQISRWIQL